MGGVGLKSPPSAVLLLNDVSALVAFWSPLGFCLGSWSFHHFLLRFLVRSVVLFFLALEGCFGPPSPNLSPSLCLLCCLPFLTSGGAYPYLGWAYSGQAMILGSHHISYECAKARHQSSHGPLQSRASSYNSTAAKALMSGVPF